MSEVDTVVGNIVEDCLLTVALILDVANLHVKVELLGNLAGTYHGIMLTCLGLLIFLHIHRARLAVNTFELALGC